MNVGATDSDSVSLADGVERLMLARGLTRRQVMKRLPDPTTRWAVYRLLLKRSVDPRLSTILAICTALGVSPTELAQAAGLHQREERSELASRLRLRAAFRQLLEMEPDLAEVAVELIEATVRSLQRHAQRGEEQTGPETDGHSTSRKPGVEALARLAI